MAPPQQSKPKAKPTVTFRTKPGKGEVKMSVLNIRGPFSTELIRPANAQSNTPAKSVPVPRPQPSVCYVTTQAAGKPVSSGTLSKGPQTPAIVIGSCLHTNRVSRRTGSCTQHLIGHSPGLRPLCLAGVSGSTLKDCLIIRSLRHQIQKKMPDSAAAQ